MHRDVYCGFHFTPCNIHRIVCRSCYFTADSTNKKSDFMKCLNSSYKAACLQCSFSDKELAEYIQSKKRNSHSITKKFSVGRVGQQADGTWALSGSVYISSTGEVMSIESSRYVWIGHMFCGAGVARDTDQCRIELPLTTDPLCALLERLKVHYGHNFMPCVLTMAATILALHYQSMLKKLKFCPLPLAYGESGTGKTTALLCALALFGACDSHFYSKVTKEKVLQLCSSSGIPVGIDDPESRNDISRLIIDLYNGAMSGSIAHGSRKPTTTCVISSNFTTKEQQRCVTMHVIIRK